MKVNKFYLPRKKTSRAIIVFESPRYFVPSNKLQKRKTKKVGRTVAEIQLFAQLSETNLSFILKDLRWHEKLIETLNYMKGAICNNTGLAN